MRNVNKTYRKPEILKIGAVTDLTGGSLGCAFDNILQTGFRKEDDGSTTLDDGSC